MNLIVYEDPNQFWNDVSPHLKFNEAKNSLVLGLSYIFKTNPKDCLYQSALFEDNKFIAALMCSQYLSPSIVTTTFCGYKFCELSQQRGACQTPC
jgi:hypothetical protein